MATSADQPPAGPTTTNLPLSAHASSVYVDPDPDENDQWEIFQALAALLCIFVECNVDPWQPEAASATSAQVIRTIESQISSFNSTGLRPGLSHETRLECANDADAVREFVFASEGLLDPQLESQYLVTLGEMIDELIDP